MCRDYVLAKLLTNFWYSQVSILIESYHSSHHLPHRDYEIMVMIMLSGLKIIFPTQSQVLVACSLKVMVSEQNY